ncbi:MAG: hypothetical protein OK439_03635 [Thaumarchaeota archaeon]|nr:hypothetical protein [Nitrososphaerota archaeon]
MPFDTQTVFYLLLVANVAIYLGLLLGIIRGRRFRLPSNPTVEEAFKILEKSLTRTFPDLPAGYTWKEVVNRLKASNLDLDWYEIEDTVRKYEEFRYGGIDYKNANVDAILRLAVSLKKVEKDARISQIQST